MQVAHHVYSEDVPVLNEQDSLLIHCLNVYVLDLEMLESLLLRETLLLDD